MSGTVLQGANDGAREKAYGWADGKPFATDPDRGAWRENDDVGLQGSSDYGTDLLSMEAGVRRAAGDQTRRLKELEQKNAKRTRLVSELSHDKPVSKDIASGNL